MLIKITLAIRNESWLFAIHSDKIKPIKLETKTEKTIDWMDGWMNQYDDDDNSGKKMKLSFAYVVCVLSYSGA